MKKYFVELETYLEAENAMPWACKIIEVEGGYMGFESIDDYEIWLAQV